MNVAKHVSGVGMVRRIVKMVRTAFGQPQQTRPTSQKPRYARLALEGLEERLVPSLTPVSPGAGFPFTSNVQIRVTFPDNQTFAASGAVIDNFHVLTAGHVIYHAADGGFATSIKVIPDLNGSTERFGYAWGTYERTFRTFTNSDQAHPGMAVPGDSDIGLITLDRDIGKRTGAMVFGWDPTNAVYTPGTIMNTAGYPVAGGYGGLQMEFSSGPIAGLSRDGSTIQYYQSSITTLSGQSGSPVWAKFHDGSRIIYGVVQGSNGTLNTATRITQPIFNTLQSWRHSDQDPGRDWVSTDPAGTVFVSNPVGGNTTVFTFQNQAVGTNLVLTGPSLQHGSLDMADGSGAALKAVQSPSGSAAQEASPAPSTNALAALTAIARTLLASTGPASGADPDHGSHIETNAATVQSPATPLQSSDFFHSTTAGTDADIAGSHLSHNGSDGLDLVWGTQGLDLASWCAAKV